MWEIGIYHASKNHFSMYNFHSVIKCTIPPNIQGKKLDNSGKNLYDPTKKTVLIRNTDTVAHNKYENYLILLPFPHKPTVFVFIIQYDCMNV